MMILRHGILSTPPPHILTAKTLTLAPIHHRQTVAASSSTTTPAISITYSISDKELESRGYILHSDFSNLDLDDLNSVFVAVGFPKREPEKIKLALENTDTLLWVEYAKTRRPVAFARVTGDGVFNAVVWDVVVDPRFQGVGLGKAVMERIVDSLLKRGITNIALYSEPRVLGFYRPLGFVSDPDGIRAMVYSRKQKRK